MLIAANLGEDADTTAAITGQLAGALYGLTNIPGPWLSKVAWRNRLEAVAASLLSAQQFTIPTATSTHPTALKREES